MLSFGKLVSDINNSIVELANIIWIDYKDAVIYDGTNFLNNIKDDFEKWTIQLENKTLSRKDFETLVRSKKDLIELKILSETELPKASLDKFMDDLLNTIISETESSIL